MTFVFIILSIAWELDGNELVSMQIYIRLLP